MRAIGSILDRWLGAHATGPFSRDEILLACLVLIESEIHNEHLEPRHHDDLGAAILDHIAPRFPDERPLHLRTLRMEPVHAVENWLDAADAYTNISSAVLNVLHGRFIAARSHSGRLLFFPAYEPDVELRAGWLHHRFVTANRRRAALPLTSELRDALAGIADRVVMAQLDTVAAHGICEPPATTDYDLPCSRAADALLKYKFSSVATDEIWGGITVAQTMAALRPLILRACRRFFLHQRAFMILRSMFGAPSVVLNSAVEEVAVADLVDDVQRSAGFAITQAEAFVRTLIRSGREDKYRPSAYPLVPLNGDRVAFAPSLVLLSLWPNIREHSLARDHGASLGNTRSRRLAERLSLALARCGYQVAIDVPVLDPQGACLTDLDVVALAHDASSALVVQVKAFVTPTNLIGIQKADKEVAAAVEQCQTADAYPASVRLALERRFAVPLPDTWTLRQMVAVEAMVGLASRAYPVVTAEWLDEACDTYRSIGDIWDAGWHLLDGKEYIAAHRSVFVLYSDLPPEIGPVAAYGEDAGNVQSAPATQ